MAGALAAGAAGVRVGTRLVAAAESAAHPAYIDSLVSASADDTMITTAFSGMWPDAPHRVLRSSVAALEAFDGDVVGEMEIAGTTMPIPKGSVPCPTQHTTGSVAAMALYAGESVSNVGRVQTAADILQELAEGAEQLLRTWRSEQRVP